MILRVTATACLDIWTTCYVLCDTCVCLCPAMAVVSRVIGQQGGGEEQYDLSLSRGSKAQKPNRVTNTNPGDDASIHFTLARLGLPVVNPVDGAGDARTVCERLARKSDIVVRNPRRSPGHKDMDSAVGELRITPVTPEASRSERGRSVAVRYGAARSNQARSNQASGRVRRSELVKRKESSVQSQASSVKRSESGVQSQAFRVKTTVSEDHLRQYGRIPVKNRFADSNHFAHRSQCRSIASWSGSPFHSFLKKLGRGTYTPAGGGAQAAAAAAAAATLVWDASPDMSHMSTV